MPTRTSGFYFSLEIQNGVLSVSSGRLQHKKGFPRQTLDQRIYRLEIYGIAQISLTHLNVALEHIKIENVKIFILQLSEK